MLEVIKSDGFLRWLERLKDRTAAARIAVRIDRAAEGNLGDVKHLREDLWEMRISYGAGYRLYFIRRGSTVDRAPRGRRQENAAAGYRTSIAARHGLGRNRAMKTTAKLPKGFTRWDTAEILKTPRDIALYLEASLAEDAGDGRLVRVALGNIARARGMTQIARKTGLTREGLYQALSKEGNPEFATVWKVMRALGIRLHAKVA